MKIAFLIGQLCNGGAEKQVYLISSELKKLNQNVLVITFDTTGVWYDKLMSASIPVYQIKRSKSFDFYRLFTLRNQIKKLKLDVLFCFGSAESIYGRLACLKISTQAIVCLRNQSWNNYKINIIDRILKPGHKYICNSYSGYHFLKETIGVQQHRLKRIPNIINHDEIIKICSNFHDSRLLKKSKNHVHVGWVGSLSDRKDPHLLLDIASCVFKINKNFHFFIIGDGPLRKQIADRIISDSRFKKVHLIGHIDNAMCIWPFMDCGLSTSRIEGTPNVLLEAMVFNKPYIAPDVGDYRYLIRDKENGFVYLRREPQHIAKIIIKQTSLQVKKQFVFKKHLEYRNSHMICEQYMDVVRIAIKQKIR